jgi:hypothetical protein
MPKPVQKPAQKTEPKAKKPNKKPEIIRNLLFAVAILALVLPLPATLQAAELADAPSTSAFIHTTSAAPCTYWTTIKDANGMFVYACYQRPMTVQIPDAYDVQRAIGTLENTITALQTKIADLERRLTELEKPHQ